MSPNDRTRELIAKHVDGIASREEMAELDTLVASDPEVARALENNYTALKDRLRQLGFFTDLSDASISQVIRPRFPINTDVN